MLHDYLARQLNLIWRDVTQGLLRPINDLH